MERHRLPLHYWLGGALLCSLAVNVYYIVPKSEYTQAAPIRQSNGAEVSARYREEVATIAVPDEVLESSFESLPESEPLAFAPIEPALVTVDAYNAPVERLATLEAKAVTRTEIATMNRELKAWFVAQPASAAAWLNEQPEPARFDQSVALVAQHLSEQKDYGNALSWAESIEAQAIRDFVVTDVVAHAFQDGAVDASEVRADVPDEDVRQAIFSGDYWD